MDKYKKFIDFIDYICCYILSNLGFNIYWKKKRSGYDKYELKEK